MKLTLVAGARPNFMKIAPILRAIGKARDSGHRIDFRLVHTGQHYDDALSAAFFRDLGIPEPHTNLGAGSGSQAEQTAAIMIGFEKELISNPADVVVVVGDVNSTLACSIVARKLLTRVAHVEAGIRSHDMTMPEEINRLVTDAISDYFFTTTTGAGENLRRAGADERNIFLVGNTMIDTLVHHLNDLQRPPLLDDAGITGKYFVLTLHRPSNVDTPDGLRKILDAIAAGAAGVPVIFPVHPRTNKSLSSLRPYSQLKLTAPLRYLEFMYLIRNSAGVITDSGGIQEETTYLKIPCITLRSTTERPETVILGTNELIGNDPEQVTGAVRRLVEGKWKAGRIPDLWDGKTSERIIERLLAIFTP